MYAATCDRDARRTVSNPIQPSTSLATAIIMPQALRICSELMTAHPQHAAALASVQMSVNGRLTRSLAKARWRSNGQRLIHFSRTLAHWMNESLIDDAVRHELAHMVAGYEAGHGPVWQRIAVLFGCQPVTSVKVAQTFMRRHTKYPVPCTECSQPLMLTRRRINDPHTYHHTKCPVPIPS